MLIVYGYHFNSRVQGLGYGKDSNTGNHHGTKMKDNESSLYFTILHLLYYSAYYNMEVLLLGKRGCFHRGLIVLSS